MPGFEAQGYIIIHYPVLPTIDDVIDYDDSDDEEDSPNERHIYSTTCHPFGLTKETRPIYNLATIDEEKQRVMIELLLLL